MIKVCGPKLSCSSHVLNFVTPVRLQPVPLGGGQLAAQQAGSGTTLASDISASTGMPPQISSALRRQAFDAAGPHAQPQVPSPPPQRPEPPNCVHDCSCYLTCCRLDLAAALQ